MNEKQFGKGEEIVSLAKINAISSFHVISEKFSQEFNYSTTDWDFYMTAASSCIALILFVPKTDEETYSKVYERVIADLEKLYPEDGNRAFLDCNNYMKNSLGVHFQPEEFILSLGSWVLWNLKRKTPEKKDRSLVSAIGMLAGSPFFTFWD